MSSTAPALHQRMIAFQAHVKINSTSSVKCSYANPASICLPTKHIVSHKHKECVQQRATIIAMSASADNVEVTVEDDAMDKMEKTLESVQRNFSTVRTGRANPNMLDRIQVSYYGTPTPLKQIAGVSTPESSLLLVQPYDSSAIPDIERAIQQSDIGLTPNNDGKVIRLQIPQLTADRRKEMTKTVSKLGEEGKVAIRNVRRDAMKTIEKLEKDAVISEDARKGLEDAVQKLTDEYIKQIEGLMKSKSDELAKV